MISKLGKKIICFLSIIAIGIVLICNIFYINNIENNEVSNIEYYGIFNLIISFIIIGLIIFVSYKLEKIKIGKKIKIFFIIIALMLYIGIQIFWINNSVTIPYADSEQLIVIANEMNSGNELSEYCRNYISYYPQQIPLIAFIALIFKIFGTTNFVILQYLNIIANVFTVIGLYFITRNLSKEDKWSKILFFILSLSFIPMIMLVTFVYGDFLGLPFAVWAVFWAIKYEKNDKIRDGIISGILLLIACMLRMNYIIFAIAIDIYWFISLLDKKERSKKEILIKIGVLILFVLIITIPNSIIKNIFVKKYDLSTEKSFSTIPYLYMGMSEGEYANGWYNNEIGDTVYHLMNDEEKEVLNLSEKVKIDLKERMKYLLQNPVYTIRFYKDKIVTTWAEPTYEYKFYNTKWDENVNIEEYFVANHILNGRFYNLSKIYQKALIFIIFIGAIAVVIINLKRLNKEYILLALVFLGGFLFHIMWETKSRYIIPYIIILIPISVIGIDVIINKTKERLKNIGTKEDLKK